LHTGECEVRGDDIGGIAVHIGARVSALSHANEVLVSSTLRDLVIGSGLEFEERGAHALKGLPGECHLFAVASLQVGLSVTCLRVDVLQHALEPYVRRMGKPSSGPWATRRWGRGW
jgi:class 3 adenylate cyclase